ncbi:hypothetical protein AAG906_017064 [Vitis piasezkii]
MAGQQERRNVGEKEGGQPSRNSGQTGPEPKEHRIDIVEISPKFIRSKEYDSKVDMSNVHRNHRINFVVQDLFLLENQLPFGILKPEGTSEKEVEELDEEPSHLLDLLRSALLGGSKKIRKQEAQGFCCPDWPSFRHIKELKAAGIHLKRSRTSFLTDISFKSCFFCGYLKLPQIIIDDFTKPKVLNIVAYEMCQDGPYDYAVTSYMCFLYDIIDHADDVKELRSKHILSNLLGSDEDVAELFNEISNDLVDQAYKDYSMEYHRFHCCCFDTISYRGSDLLRNSR